MKKRLIMSFIVLSMVLTGCGASTGGASYEGAQAYTNNSFSYADGVSDTAAYDVKEEVAVETEYESDILPNNTEEKDYSEKLVYTCSMQIETLEYDKSLSSIREKIKAAGGFISYEDEYDNDYDWYLKDHEDTHSRTISMQARIPSKKYDSFTASLDGDGKVISRSSTVDNISKEYYDTEAVIESLKIQEERLMGMMDEAKTIEEMIAVEARLTEVQTQLNQYNTSLAAMQTDVDYSTVNITLEEVYEYTPDVQTDTFFDRLKNTLKDAWESFGDTLENLLFFVIMAIPQLLIYIPVIIVVVIIIKKVKKVLKRNKKDKITNPEDKNNK